MAGQGGESIPGLDPRPAQVVNADQGHASLYSSLTPGNQSWSLSTGQSVSSSVFPYDPQSQLSVSANSQSGNYSVSHASIPPTLGSASVTNEYSGYPSYSSSSVPYTYSSSSTDYQNYYYNYPQPVHQSSAQQVDPNPNTGAAYQPLSSFQNSGSYVSPPSYLSTYYNAGDYQTTSGYGQSSNNYQNNSRNDGNYGNYQSQHYANYASTDTNSTQSSTTANSLYYQQQYNQWPYYYSHPAPITNGTSGSENVTSFANSLPAGYSTAGASGGYSYVSNQPPPPGTTSWRNESVSSVPSSQGKDTGTAYALNNGLESSALVSQSQNINQSYVQMPPVSNFQNENHESEQKLFYSQAPSLQHSCSNQVPQNLQQQPHPAFTTDAHQVSKVQIMVNPRIAPNVGFGMLKSQKENSATHAAVKPAYVSVSLPKVDSKPASQDDAQGTAKGKLPASLCAYVDRAFARCKDDAQRSASQNIMKEIITKATEEGTLYAKNWDTEPLFPLPSSSSSIIDQSNSQNLVSGSFLPKVTRSPGRRIKSRWEPVAEEKVGDAFSPVNIEALSKVSNFSGWNGVKFVASQQQSPLSKISQSPRKKLRISDSSNLGNGDASGDSDKEQGLTKFHASAITLASSAEERKRREHRFKRFEKGQGNKVEMNHLKSKSTEGGYAYAKRPSTTLYVKKYEDVSSVAVEDINWDSLTVKGTCQEIEKRYLRLTSAPDPATVRPEDVLEKALEMVHSSKKNYLYKCDQLKSIRQDLTVQRIQNTFTAKVYETHARFALEAGDLHEYNQCQSQLKRLYSEGIDGNHKEFSAYNLLYIILHTNNKRDLLSSLTRLSYEAKADEAVKHALAVRGAVSSGNYILFFRLYKEAPNLNACLMDLYTEKMRFEAIKCMCKSYRPVVPVPYVSRVLGFSKLSENGDSKVVVDGTEDCEEWLKAHGAVVTVDNNEERQLDTKASSSSLYMPEPEDAVAHGDASLGVDDFLARASQTPVL